MASNLHAKCSAKPFPERCPRCRHHSQAVLFPDEEARRLEQQASWSKVRAMLGEWHRSNLEEGNRCYR